MTAWLADMLIVAGAACALWIVHLAVKTADRRGR